MNNETVFTTPVGRLVQGDAFKPQVKDAEGRPLVIKTGVNIGQQTQRYFIAIAIPKTNPEYNEIWQKILTEAKTGFPNLFDASGNCISPEFAFKVTDGDSQVPNTRGVAPCTREGFPGHWVLNFTTSYAPKCYTAGGKQVIVEPEQIKRGYWIRVYGGVKGNGQVSKPGVYLSHHQIELYGYGEEIISGPQGDQVFGQAPANIPQGVSSVPIAGAPIAQTGPAAAGPAAAGPAAAGPANAGPANAGPATAPFNAGPANAGPANAGPANAGPAPAPDFLNGPQTPAMTPAGAATGFTYDQYVAQGWTDDQLKAQGYIA